MEHSGKDNEQVSPELRPRAVRLVPVTERQLGLEGRTLIEAGLEDFSNEC
jgi:hypothetical protein